MSFANLHDLIGRSGGAMVLRNARLPAVMAPSGLEAAGDGLVTADLWLARGGIEDMGACGRTGDGRTEVDLAKAMVWALPVDCHTHVDKGQTWNRSPNPDGTFPGAQMAAAATVQSPFDAEDTRARARFILDCAVAHGTAALRSHVDAKRDSFDARFGVMCELAEQYSDRIGVQLAPFTGLSEDPEFVAELARRARGVLSAFIYRAPGVEAFLDLIFALADRHGLALDFHADETLDPDSHCLRAIAGAVLRHGFEGPVLVGHACALSVQDAGTVAETLDLVQRAGIGVVALPLCNAYLQGRGPLSPRLRGIAPLHEVAAQGIPVAIASDNVRDGFHAYGDMDLVEVYRQSILMMHLDHPVGDWPATITTTPARLIGHPGLGHLRAGGPADLMILPARNWSEFGARPASARLIMRAGRVQDTAPPPFSALDHLKGMTP